MTKPGQDKYLRTYEQVSSGGVVFRTAGSSVEIIIVQIAAEPRWQLPKGLIDEGETSGEAALREVREEAGVEAESIGPIDTIEYWFTADYDGERRRYHKLVHFFLMRYKAGDVADHDDEVTEARWVGVDKALEMLDFKNERKVVEKAASMIADSIEP